MLYTANLCSGSYCWNVETLETSWKVSISNFPVSWSIAKSHFWNLLQIEKNYNEYLIFQNIREYIESSPHGVIYFTFGSVIAMSSLPDHIQDILKNVFRQIPQRVLWKYEGEMEDKPDNVMTGNWFPQRDVLCECFFFYCFYLLFNIYHYSIV